MKRFGAGYNSGNEIYPNSREESLQVIDHQASHAQLPQSKLFSSLYHRIPDDGAIHTVAK